MKKGVLVAAGVLVAIASAAIAWWFLRDDGAPHEDAASAPAAGSALSAVQRNERAERVRAAVAHHRRLWREATYVEVRDAAMGGDAVAQRRLSEIYDDCLAYAGQMSMALRMLGTLTKADPAAQPTVKGIYADYKHFCVQADADLRKNPDAGRYWLHKSAKAGDLASEMRYFGRTVAVINSGQVKYFVDKLRASGDPDAIFEMALLMVKVNEPWPDPALAPVFRGEQAQSAWMLAACRAGYDCARGSRVLNTVCMTMFACTYPDYERYLWFNNDAPAQRAELTRLVTLIERDILQMQPTR